MKIRKHVSMLAATAAFATVSIASADVVFDSQSLMSPGVNEVFMPRTSIVVAASESALPDVNDRLIAAFTLDTKTASFTAGSLHHLMLEMHSIGTDTRLLELLDGETRSQRHDDAAWELFFPDLLSDAKTNRQDATFAATPGAIALLALAGCIGCLRHRAD